MIRDTEKKIYLSTRKGGNAGIDTPVIARKKTVKRHVSLHWHDHFEMEFIVSGHGRGVMNGMECELKPGIIYLLTPADFHDITPDGELQLIHVGFDQNAVMPELIEKIFAAENNMWFQLGKDEYVRFYSLLIQLVTETKSDEKYKFRLMSDVLESVFILLLRKSSLTDTGKSTQKTYVTRAIAYLEIHFRESPGLDEIAEYVGLNRNYFCSMFRAETGKTLVQYIRDLKLSYGRKMIKATDLTINEICYKCGFNSFSAFIHEFKKKFGETPLQCRKNNKVDTEV